MERINISNKEQKNIKYVQVTDMKVNHNRTYRKKIKNKRPNEIKS